jgi:YYY domain-containing protein
LIYDLDTATRRRSRTSTRKRWRLPRLNSVTTFILLLLILAVGGYLRSINLANWDERQGLHPDERFVSVAVGNLRLPASLNDYWDSANSTLNPRNFDWSRMWVYGTLPTTITRVVATLTNQTDDVLLVGRVLSGVFDLVACVALFGLGRLLAGRKAGLLAAALYAVTVMSIQQAHFFTTDNFAVAFATLALVSATRLGLYGRWRDAVFAGLWTGAAVASKINLAALAAIIGLAALQYYARRVEQVEANHAVMRGTPLRSLVRAGLLLAVAGIVTFGSFRVFQPDAFSGPHIWNIWPEARFLQNLQTVRGLVDGTVDMPPSHQWASRVPYLWPWQNMVLWGMGVPLGIMAWLGWGAAGVRLLRRGRRGVVTALTWRYLVPWVWIALYWAWQGRGFNPSLRYFLPIYPPLILFAAVASLVVGRWLRVRLAGRWRRPGRRALVSALPTVVLLFCTASWAWGFTRIYTRPHSRVAAGEWMVATQPHRSFLTTEQWDDALPYTNGNGAGCVPFCLVETTPYAEDEPSKYLGKPDIANEQLDPNLTPDGLVAQLSRADYVVLSSARVYSSIERLPHRFPVALRYYQALFDGSLGFDLVGDFHSFPSFLGLPVSDLHAEEQFTVYDHPRVLIFKRTDRFSPDLARDLLTRDVVWSEMYRISAKLTSAAPDALRVSDRSWERFQQSDSAYLWNADPLARGLRLIGVPRADAIAGTLTLVVALELLGLAMLGIMRRWRIPTPDGGVVSAQFGGLLLFAMPLVLLMLSDRFTVSRTAVALWYGLVVGFGLRLVWAERHALLTTMRRRVVLAGSGVYVVVLMVGLALRAFVPDAPTTATAIGSAQWAAMVRAPILPPPDPLFAGGHLAIPYAALLPAALLTRMAGIAPAIAYDVWLALFAALLGALVWALAGRVRPVLRLAVAALALAPSLVVAAGTPLGALAGGNIAVLATVVLAVGTLVFVRGATLALHQRRPWGGIAGFAVAIVALTLLRAQNPWSAWALVLSIVVLVALARRAHPARRAMVATALVLAPMILAHPLMVVVPTLPIDGDFATGLDTASPSGFILQYGFVLVVATMVMLLLGTRTLVDRAMYLVGVGVIAIMVVGAAVNLSPLITLSPLALALLWLLLEATTAPQYTRRMVPVFALALVGVLLLAVSGRMMAVSSPGDAALVGTLGAVLLLCATGLALPIVPRRSTMTTPIQTFMTGLSVVGLVWAALAARPEALPAPTEEHTGGVVAALVEDARNGGVVAVAPQPDVPAIIARSGLPALLLAPDETAATRDILRPSMDVVIEGRRNALAAIFGGDPGQALAQLSAYAVQYVAVGPAERATYGDTAGAALRSLLSTGAVSVVYENADWTLFRRSTDTDVVPYVAPTATLDLPSTKTGLLAQPLRSLPVVDEYAWNRWANGNDLLAIALWLVLFEVLGLLALPLSGRIFNRSLDGGWAWSKLIGLGVWSYAIWLPVSLGWWTYHWWSLVAGALVLAGLSWFAAGRPWGRAWRRPAPRFGTRMSWRESARVEAIFVVAFGAWTLVRMANPDLWHPWLGGEKPFEFGMLNAIVRSPVMPPPDPFFSGGIINYYYYGLFIVSVPIRATGIDPAIAFNLIVPTLFGFVLAGSAAVVRTLTGQWRWGLLGAAMVGVLGPAASAWRFGESRGLGVVVDALRPGLSGWGSRLGDWFWGPSRIIPGTINEFPFFAYLFADLHPHMIALPFTILGVALAVEVYRAPTLRRSWVALALGALVIGTLAAANSWDAPTAGLVLGGALIGHAWRIVRQGTTSMQKVLHLGRAALLGVAVLVAGLALVLPFFLHYQAMVGGIGRVRQGDSVLQWVAISGVHGYVALSVLCGIAWTVVQRIPSLRRPRRVLATGASSIIAMVLLGAWVWTTTAAQPTTSRIPVLTVLLAGLVALAVVLAFTARLQDEEWLVLWLITAGLMVALGIQLVFVRDHLSGGDWERMNTVFKFGLQVWTLLALAAAAGTPMMLRLLGRWSESAVSLWLVPLGLLLLMGATYPVVATASRTSLRFDPHPPLTLDGLAFMDTARYEHDGDPIDLSGDAQAIRWLKENITGLPVILQSEAEFYRANGVRIAANTGFPTVLGRLHQDEQRPSAGVIAREEDVKLIYNTTDPATATSLLAKYSVDYVYVGPAERAFYDEAGLAKWDALEGRALDTVYENETVRIYRVRPGLEVTALPDTATSAPDEPEPQPITNDAELEALEDAQAAQPNDAGAAYSLANRYIQNGRLEDAARVLTSAAALNPNDIALHHFLGDTQARIGNAEAAIAAWSRAADINPTSGNIAKLGTGLTALGRYDEAEQVLLRAGRADPNDALVHFYLGENARQRNGAGDTERARNAYTTYLQEAPADSPFRGTAEEALRTLGE